MKTLRLLVLGLMVPALALLAFLAALVVAPFTAGWPHPGDGHDPWGDCT